MSRLSREQIDKLVKTLARAHELRDQPPLSPHWLETVMREVRRQPAGSTPFTEAPRLIWRAAAVTALVSALFMGSVLGWNMDGNDTDAAALIADASLDPTLPGGEP